MNRINGGVVRLSVDATEATPKWNRLLATREMYRSDFAEGIELQREDLETMVRNWKASGGQPLQMNYFHFGSSNRPMPIEQKVASGWIQDLRIVPFTETNEAGESVECFALEGLVEWTDRAREFIKAKEMCCLSPEFAPNAINSRTGKPQGPTLYGAALLNDPFLTELPRVAASNSTTHTSTTEAAQAEGNTMNMKMICAAVAMAETTPEAEVVAVVKMNADAAKKLPELKNELIAMSAKAEALGAEKLALVEQTNTLTAEVSKLKAEKFDLSVSTLTEKLVKAGKVAPVNASTVVKMAKAIGIDEAEKFFSAQPAIVDLTEKGHGDGGGEPVPADKEAARLKFNALVDAEIKTGATTSDAFRKVSKSNPELAQQIR